MSTKIYYGFRFQGDIHQFLETVEFFRPWIKRQGKKLLEEFMARGPKFSDWLDDRRDVAHKGLRNPLVDTDFKLTVFPRRDGFVYGIAYHDHPAWFERWLKVPGVTEYGYWNNTDEPEGMSAEEWEARKKKWDELIPPPHVPAMFGLSIDVSDPMGPMPKGLED
jgi:hypothetical protein